MNRLFKFYAILILILTFSCTVDQDEVLQEEETLEAVSLKHGSHKSKINVEVLDCGLFRITSDKRIRKIVYRVDGVDTTIRPNCYRTYDLMVADVTDIWVQSGRRRYRNRYHGHRPKKRHIKHFKVDDSKFCEHPPVGCTENSDCTTSCGEGGLCTSIVGGRVFNDTNGDGIFNSGDTGAIAGVQLQVNTAEGWTNLLFEVTNDSGFYNFQELNPLFEYRIRVSPPAGETFEYTTQNIGEDDTIDSDVNADGISDSVEPGPNNADTTLWAGVLPKIVDPFEPCDVDSDCPGNRCGEGGYCTAIVGGRIFNDANGDGIFNTGDSGAVAGVHLQILVEAGWVDFSFEVTDAEGNYSFTSLNAYNGPGNPEADSEYRIRLIPPPGDPAFVYTQQNVGDDDTIDSDMNPVDGFTDGVNPDPGEIINTVWVGILPE